MSNWVAQFPSSVLAIAHRGARAYAPENTLEAIDKAASLGAGAIEIDVQLSSDGEVIVVHDETLDRCSNVREEFPGRSDHRVSSFTLDEIANLDAGSWFVRAIEAVDKRMRTIGASGAATLGRDDPDDGARTLEVPAFMRSMSEVERREFISSDDLHRYSNDRVRHPTLEQVLVRVRELGLRINIELKPFVWADRLVDRVANLIEAFDRDGTWTAMGTDERPKLWVSSFNHAALRRLKAVAPRIPIGLLTERALPDPVSLCRQMDAIAYHPGAGSKEDAVGFDSDEFRRSGRLPPEPIQTVRSAGLDVFVWTVNDRDRMRSLMEAGVSGIFTDYPNRLTRAAEVR